MYTVSEQQIDYILNDIRRNGVEMEDLQLNLLDHVCCIIEQNLKDGDDFENFYQKTIKQFYKKQLWEIEEETITLLTFKNYYAMKKIMLASGIFSASFLTVGIIFKFMHWPGTTPLILLGIVSLSLIFLPLLFTLKAKEKQNNRDKAIIGLGTLSAISMSLGILFKIMHWPGANMLVMCAIGIILLLFLPIYFLSGIRKAETKTNTAVTSILLIAGCGLFLSLVNSRARLTKITEMKSFVRNEQLLSIEQKQITRCAKEETVNSPIVEEGKKIKLLCAELKSTVLEGAIGSKTLDPDFENKNIIIDDYSIGEYLRNSQGEVQALNDLSDAVDKYNSLISSNSEKDLNAIPVKSSMLEYLEKKGGHGLGMITVLSGLNYLSQVHMFVLQNERELIAVK